MAEAPRSPDLPDIPEAVAASKSRWSLQLIWLVPLVAVLIGGWLAVKAIMSQGTTITITFDTAEGLEAGKTKIKFKDVEIGLVQDVSLSEDITRVIVTAELNKGMKRYLSDHARFWVVRPRISGGNVSGIGTLFSGAYIGMDIGKAGKDRRHFIGLKEPPVISSGGAGREFVLHSEDIGSLDIGSPIYFRHLQAGQLSAYSLDKDSRGVTLKVFVNAPYDQYVNDNTRFWHASGIDVNVGSQGVQIKTQSIEAILLGGLAFETPAESIHLPPAAAGTSFWLFDKHSDAMKNPEKDIMKFVLVFRETVRGLAVGAPVDFRGIDLGEVTAIDVEMNAITHRMSIPVMINLYPARLRARQIVKQAVLSERARMAFLDGMAAQGLRGQLRSGNLLTGQLFIALDFFPEAAKAKIAWNNDPPEMPTQPGGLQNLETKLQQTLDNTNNFVRRLDTETLPEVTSTLQDTRRLLDSTRALTDYLERHPEALISGKKEEKQ